MRMDFLSIFLDDLRGPRKTACFVSNSAGNHDMLQATYTNFQGLVFIPKMDKLLLQLLLSSCWVNKVRW